MKISLCLCLCATFMFPALAQVGAGTSSGAAVDPADAWAALLQALEARPPLPPAATPEGGQFYTVQHGDDWPPLPANTLDLPFWDLGAGYYVLDDRKLDYAELQAQAELAALLAGGFPGQPGGSQMMMSSLASGFAYANPVYLTNLVATSTGAAPVTASFSIEGGTNNVPYDILTTTNVADSLAQWNWLGLGYPSNRYTSSNQPVDQAYYILAKPQQTMVVGWGDDSVGQCDVPMGITNAMMVAGGSGQSLALLSNGTVVAWGYNYYGIATVPTNLAGVSMIAAGWLHDVVLLTNGHVVAWGAHSAEIGYTMTNVPPDLTNATVIAAQAYHNLALTSNGTVVAWGYNPAGETNVPAGLSNVVAIAAGWQHSLAVKADGTVAAWGLNTSGQCNVPVGLSNAVDVAAGIAHSVALRNDGTVIAWGRNIHGETNVPAGLGNVVAIAAGGDIYNDSSYTLALKSDNTVAAWGGGGAVTPLGGMSNVIAIANGADHALAIRSGPRTPVITLQPTDQFQIAGGNVTFSARGAGLYGVAYQWQTNGVNLAGATSNTLSLTNVQAAQAGVYTVTVSNEVGTIVSPNANLSLVTPPVITSMTLPTNQVCIYGNMLAFSVTATSVGQFNGFPLNYQWNFNGPNITSATNAAYSFTANDDSSGIYSVTVANVVGNTNVSWQVTVTNAIDVTKDLLLIYNTNSPDSSNVWYYYMQHRPMVSTANVLAIGCTNTESFLPSEYTNIFVPQIGSWLTNNPTKRPQYVILFLDIPSRVNTNRPPPPGSTDDSGARPCVSYSLSTQFANWRPFVMHLNMGTITDCKAYIDKLEYFGTNNSPGQLVISANSLGDHGNTNINYVLDGIRHGGGYTNGVIDKRFPDYSLTGSGVVSAATNGLLNAGVPTNAILFYDGVETYTNNGPPPLALAQHPTSKINIAGYMCWGAHSALTAEYPTTSGYTNSGYVKWVGTNRWWIIETPESLNGQRVTPSGSPGTFIRWFSAGAFGGTNYSNTPVGAVTHVDEPQLPGVNDATKYFGSWASGENFAIAAWNSRRTAYFQAVGDPLVQR